MILKKECVGCSACEYICPKNCIKMEPNSKGFLYPVINMDSCIECGACADVCQIINPVKKNSLPRNIYAVSIKNTDALLMSSSGGAAWLFSSEFLKKGGIVYGAAFDENLVVSHIRIEDMTDLKRIQGSKYVQSDIRKIYPKLKNDLNAKKNVLVFGTPCQIAGIKKVFGNRKNLILCDIICHSAPSPKIFADHIAAIQAKGKKVRDYRFRDKAFGWRYNLNRILYENGSEELHSYWNQCYKRLFLLNLIARDECYECAYADCKRVGDITLGDFWGIEKISDKFVDDKGVSVVFFNNEKGWVFDKSIKEKAIWMEATLEDALQEHLIMPCERLNRVDSFWEYYEKTSYKETAEYFAGGYYYLTIRNRVKDFLEEHHLLNAIKKRKG